MKRALVALALVAPPALGAPEGPTFTVFSRPTVTRFADVAYDAEADVFLVVSGQVGVTARFVAAGGPMGEPFEVTTDSMAYSPRVTTVGNGFLVCWHVESTTSVLCRSVSPAGALGAEHVLSTSPAKNLESAPSLACSKAHGECLVTWADAEESVNLRGRRVALDGAPIAPVLDLAVNPGVFDAFPALALSESRGEYFVAHTLEPGSAAMAVSSVRVAIGGGVSGVSELYALDGFNNYPEVAADPDRDRYLAVSWINAGNPDVGGRLIGGDGTPLGAELAVAASSGFEGGDGIGVAFDRGAATYLAVFQGPETPGQAQEVWGAAVSAEGSVSPSFQVTTASAINGVYQPRAAATGAGRFLVVTVVDYSRVDAQWVTFPVIADAGPGGAGGGWNDGGGPAGSAGAGGSGAASRGDTAAGDDGCGCSTAPDRSSFWPLALLAVMAALRARRACAVRPRRW